jgi:hypothetical protein
MMISIQYDHIDTQYGWRRRRALSPFFSSLFLVGSLSLFFLYGWEHRRKKKEEIERNINYWIRIVYYFNSSTWFVVYKCMYMRDCSKGVRVYCSTQILFSYIHILSLSLFLCCSCFYLNNSSPVRYASA